MDKPSLLTRVSSSPLLLVILLLATSTVAAAWYKADAAQRAPAIPGYDWDKHPNALLLAYPSKDCGCGSSPDERVEEGLKQGLDVLVIAAAPSKSLDVLQKSKFSPSRFSFITNVSPEVIHRISPSDKPAAMRIQHGRIVNPVKEVNR